MNEAFSDIWGACIEYYAAPGKSTWLMEGHRREPEA
jgi:Zn-dependent metalloprotease